MVTSRRAVPRPGSGRPHFQGRSLTRRTIRRQRREDSHRAVQVFLARPWSCTLRQSNTAVREVPRGLRHPPREAQLRHTRLCCGHGARQVRMEASKSPGQSWWLTPTDGSRISFCRSPARCPRWRLRSRRDAEPPSYEEYGEIVQVPPRTLSHGTRTRGRLLSIECFSRAPVAAIPLPHSPTIALALSVRRRGAQCVLRH